MRTTTGLRIDVEVMEKVRHISDVEGVRIYRVFEDAVRRRIGEFEKTHGEIQISHRSDT